MFLAPEINISDIKYDKIKPSKTYKLDFNNKRIPGFIDGKEAVKQFIKKAMVTARYKFDIYNSDYGCEINEIIGQNLSENLLKAEIERVIKEALIYDERIQEVYDFKININKDLKDSVNVDFTVDSVEGILEISEVF